MSLLTSAPTRLVVGFDQRLDGVIPGGHGLEQFREPAQRAIAVHKITGQSQATDGSRSGACTELDRSIASGLHG
ncbi:MAG: hypothetical protein WCS42_17940, partial [Verrucomicrobiota bacterium]